MSTIQEENLRLKGEIEQLKARLKALEVCGSQPACTTAVSGAPCGAPSRGPAASDACPCPSGPSASYVSSCSLTKPQAERYSRQLLLPSFGPGAQARLCHGSVLIVGCGGLGAPVALYLAAAGVGRLGLVDHDTVEISNLHRQIIHTEARAGTHKADSAAAAVAALNSGVKVEVHRDGLKPDNAAAMVGRYDVVIDCSDNAPTRYLLSDACAARGRPLVSAAAVGTDGQLTVYCHGDDGPCYRCLFPEPPAPGNCARCADAGVLGPVPGVMGVLQALEAVKLLSGVGEPLSRRLMLFDGLFGRFTTVRLRARAPACVACGAPDGAPAGAASGAGGAEREGGGGGLQGGSEDGAVGNGGGGGGSGSRGRMQPDDVAAFDYAAFTGQSAHDGPPAPLCLLPPEQRLSAAQLQQLLQQQPLSGASAAAGPADGLGGAAGAGAALLIDVRPKQQHEVMALPGSVNMPLDNLEKFRSLHLPEIMKLAGASSGTRDANGAAESQQGQPQGGGTVAAAAAALRQARPVYVMCRRGNNSQLAVLELRAAGLARCYDLIGGIEAWAAEVDPSMPVL